MTSLAESFPPITADKPTPAIWVKVWFEPDKKFVWQGYLSILPPVGALIEPESIGGGSGMGHGFVTKLLWRQGMTGGKSYAWVDLFYNRAYPDAKPAKAKTIKR